MKLFSNCYNKNCKHEAQHHFLHGGDEPEPCRAEGCKCSDYRGRRLEKEAAPDSWVVLSNPLAYKGEVAEFKGEIARYKARGKKVMVDMHHWIDIPYITMKTMKALRKLGCDGAIISETGGFELRPLKDFVVMYRSQKFAQEMYGPKQKGGIWGRRYIKNAPVSVAALEAAP